MQSILIFIAPLLSILLVTLGAGFFTTFISIKLAMEGASQLGTGIIHSAYYAGMLTGSLLIEPYIRRMGHIRAYSVFASVATSTVLLQALYVSVPFWVMMRFIFGFCFSGFYVVIESWLLSKSTMASRTTVLSIYMVVLYAMQCLSQSLLVMMNLQTLLPFIVSAFFCCLSLIPLAVTQGTSPEIEKPGATNIKSVLNTFKLSPFGFMGCLFSGIILGALLTLVPVFAYHYDYSVVSLMQVTIAGGCILQWPIGRLSDFFPRYQFLLYASITSAFSAFIILVFTWSPPVVYVFSFILGGSSFPLYTLSITKVCDNLRPSQITNVTAVLLFAYGVGSTLGPFLASCFMDWVSINSLYAFICAAACILSFLGAYLKNKE